MLITKIEWTKKSNFEKMALPNGVVVNEEKSSDFAMEKTKLFELKGEAASLPRNFCWAYFSFPFSSWVQQAHVRPITFIIVRN